MNIEPEMLYARWKGQDALAVGSEVFGLVPIGERPGWAAGILRAIAHEVPECSTLVGVVLAVAEQPNRWAEGHRAFSMVRREVLRLDEEGNRSGWTEALVARAHLLAVAELVAKVAYNSTDPSDPFDDDSGHWLSVCLRGFVEQVHDPLVEAKAWRAFVTSANRTAALAV